MTELYYGTDSGSNLQWYSPGGTAQDKPILWVDGSGNLITFPTLAASTLAFVNSSQSLAFLGNYSPTIAGWNSPGHAPGFGGSGSPTAGRYWLSGNGWGIGFASDLSTLGTFSGGSSLVVSEASYQNLNLYTVPYWVFRIQQSTYMDNFDGAYFVVDENTVGSCWKYTLTLLSSGTIGTNQIIGANAAVNGFAVDLPFPDSDPSALQTKGNMLVGGDLIFAQIAEWPTATLADILANMQLQLGDVYGDPF